MKRRRCSACGRLFQPCATVKNQQYCPERSCQRERKRRWQQKKRSEDPAYRANQRDAHNRWAAKNPGYWQAYRERHPDSVRRNRERQRERNRRRERIRDPIAKMDALGRKNHIMPGRYQLVPLDENMIAKMDAIHVRIDVIPRC